MSTFRHFALYSEKMNSHHWKTCKDPLAMLAFLEREFILTERKCRLAMIAMCRHFQQRFTDPRHSKLLGEAERAMEQGGTPNFGLDHSMVATALRCVVSPDAYNAILSMCLTCRNYRLLEFPATADVFRDIWWNPYEANPISSSPYPPSPTSVEMAKEAYYARSPNGVMNRDLLAILADSLESDGVCDPRVREHLLRTKPHYQGDWLIDILLGRN